MMVQGAVKFIRIAPQSKKLAGLVFGRLTALGPVERDEKGNIIWLCRCECGNDKLVMASRLTFGQTKSCGCLGPDVSRARARHGHTAGSKSSAEYRAWQGMHNRCRLSSRDAPRYAERGIEVCERWSSFENFLADMGPKPESELTLDRINNDGDYEPGNCRWATRVEQQCNRCCNRIIEAHGQSKTLSQWSREKGIKPRTIAKRLRSGDTPEHALREVQR